jgi:transcription elongation factor Elf1
MNDKQTVKKLISEVILTVKICELIFKEDITSIKWANDIYSNFL